MEVISTSRSAKETTSGGNGLVPTRVHVHMCDVGAFEVQP